MSQRTVFLLALSVLLGFAGDAVAATNPATSAMGYKLYDILVLQGIGGAPGYAIGAAGVAYTSAKLFGGAAGILGALSGYAGSGLFLAAPTVVESFGAIF